MNLLPNEIVYAENGVLFFPVSYLQNKNPVFFSLSIGLSKDMMGGDQK